MQQILRKFTIKSKLTTNTILSCVLLIIVASIGFYGMYTFNTASDHLVATALERKDLVANMSIDVQSLLKSVNRLLVSYSLDKDMKQAEAYYKDTTNEIDAIYTVIDNYQLNLNNDRSLKDEARNLLLDGSDDLRTMIDDYKSNLAELWSGVSANNVEKIDTHLGIARDITAQIDEELAFLKQKAVDREKVLAKETDDTFIRLVITMIVLILIVIVLSIFLALQISKSITSPINRIVNVMKKIASGDFSENLSTTGTDEISILSNSTSETVANFKKLLNDFDATLHAIIKGDFSVKIDESSYNNEFAEMSHRANATVDNIVQEYNAIADCAKQYADGNLSYNCNRFEGDKAVIHESFDNMQSTLNTITSSITDIIQSVDNGDLNVTVDYSSVKGDWSTILEQLNTLVSAISIPVHTVLEILQTFSEGNFATAIDTDTYRGEFRDMMCSMQNTSRFIRAYIDDISNVLSSIAKNDLSITTQQDYIGDFTQIKSSMDTILKSLNTIMSEIRGSSEQINVGAESVAQTATSLAAGATRQQTSTQELTETLSKLVEISDQSNEHINASKDNANGAATEADTVRSMMQKLLDSVNEVMEAQNNISTIIRAIEDIAFQTNILALNASVEAARAGEHGKGFAVVADEVRNLATKSQEQSKTSTEYITISLQKAQQALDIAQQTGDQVNKILEYINSISELSNEIVVDTKSQRNALTSVNEGITQVGSVTNENMANSENLAAASEELASQATTFNELVSKFKLRSRYQ